jgi:hypothetical protein
VTKSTVLYHPPFINTSEERKKKEEKNRLGRSRLAQFKKRIAPSIVCFDNEQNVVTPAIGGIIDEMMFFILSSPLLTLAQNLVTLVP